jgi:ribosomal protein S18 acetylase RimI-like enzyme
VHDLLYNPVFNALTSGDKHLGFGNEKARAFSEDVSPFAGFADGYENGFDDLYDLFNGTRYILFATPARIGTHGKWKLIQHIEGIQMIYQGGPLSDDKPFELVPLNSSHVSEMVSLAELTKPGPFGLRTIEFGNYYGVFEDGKLVAMTGQRMHVNNYTEVSAVCTHPLYAGKGYASALVRHQVNLVLEHGQIPFLHVRGDNAGAIRVYERLGFYLSRPMNFYFLRNRVG